LFEDVGSTRIDLACPRCQQLFKVRLRKLQFGADLVCRLCRHEFAAKEIAENGGAKFDHGSGGIDPLRAA
jgi:hypothetical protein